MENFQLFHFLGTLLEFFITLNNSPIVDCQALLLIPISNGDCNKSILTIALKDCQSDNKSKSLVGFINAAIVHPLYECKLFA